MSAREVNWKYHLSFFNRAIMKMFFKNVFLLITCQNCQFLSLKYNEWSSVKKKTLSSDSKNNI